MCIRDSPKRAREMSVMRVFGPVNSGYSTGMMAYTEHSGSWESEKEIAEGYLNNMGASYEMCIRDRYHHLCQRGTETGKQQQLQCLSVRHMAPGQWTYILL